MKMTTALALTAVLALIGAAPCAASHGMSPELTISAQDFDEYLPQSAYNPDRGEYLVVWHDNSGFQTRSVMGKRLDRWGNTLAEFVIAYNPTRDSAQPAVAYDPVNHRYLVAYLRDTFGDASDWDLWGRLVPWDGPSGALTEFNINAWTTHQWSPRVGYASTEAEFFVTWTNENQTSPVPLYISGIRINPANGSALAPAMLISSGAEHRFDAELAYNRARNEYLIVYTLMNGTQGDIWAVRMNADGSILGGGEFAVAAWPDGEEYPKVAASPGANKWLVVWHSLTASAMKDVYGRFVNGDGTIDGDPVHFAFTTVDERYPSVSCIGDSSRFFVTWSQQFSSATGAIGVRGQAIDADHSLDPATSLRDPFSGEDPQCVHLAATGGGSNSLVVWETTRAVGGFKDIHGRVVHDPFGDGFESGDWSLWSSVSP